MKEQSYSSHAAWFPLFHFVVLPFLLIYVLRTIWVVYEAGTAESVWAAGFAIAMFLLALCARAMATKVQDRVIRLEMRLRLASVLPVDLRGQISGLTPDQLVGLRFASDAEMPELVRRVLAGELREKKAIKQAVKHWQPDHLRA